VQEQPTAHVRDPAALRALSHPLRLKLLGLLRVEGPATASALGRRLNESSGATSYHLRELARFGFAEEVPGRGTARERWWQAVHRYTEWHADDVDDAAVVEELEHQVVQRRGRVLAAWLTQRRQLGDAWRAAGHLNDDTLRLTPEQARQLNDELVAVVDRWAAEHPAAEPAEGTHLVSVHVDLLPLAEWPP
jgi:DNA-binding transcriptional ArsR family regulator